MYSLPWPQADSLRAHPFVWSIAAIACIPFALIVSQGLPSISSWFVPSSIAQLSHAPWRLLTPTFVHYTPTHLFTNIYLWWYFGSQLENQSRLSLVALFVIASLIPNAAQWFWVGPHFGGLSGVVYALLSYSWCLSYFGNNHTLKIDKWLSLLLLLLLPVAATGLLGKFSNVAHFTGLACGALLGGLKVVLQTYQQRNQNV